MSAFSTRTTSCTPMHCRPCSRRPNADPASRRGTRPRLRIDASGNPLPALRFDEFGASVATDCGHGGSRVRAASCRRPSQTSLSTHTVFPPAVALLRTSALAQTTGFDPDLAWWHDWDLFLRLARLGDFAFVDQVVVDYRLHDANMSGAPEL